MIINNDIKNNHIDKTSGRHDDVDSVMWLLTILILMEGCIAVLLSQIN